MAGQSGGEATGLVVHDLLQSTKGKEEKTIQIDASARDNGNTYLRAGLVLCPLDASGRYIQYVDGALDGSGVAANAVVLGHDVDVADGEHATASAYFRATLRTGKAIVVAGFDWSACQRIRRF
jgi:hypothetical protein